MEPSWKVLHSSVYVPWQEEEEEQEDSRPNNVNTVGGANISDVADFHSSLLDVSGSAGTYWSI